MGSSVIYGVTLSASAARLCVMQCSCLLMCKRTMADCKEGSQDIWYLTSGMGGEGQQTHLLWKTPVPHEGSRMCSIELLELGPEGIDGLGLEELLELGAGPLETVEGVAH